MWKSLQAFAVASLFAASFISVSVAQESATQEQPAAPAEEPVELEVVKSSIGVWDCEFKVWAQGPDADPMTFKGVETNRGFGEYWLASDLESTMMGQTIVVHSIIGYDLDKKSLTGMVVDHGPYAATMEGEYDPATKTVKWTTHAKTMTGEPMVQKTVMTLVNDDERILVLNVPGPKEGEVTKFMEIRYVRRKPEPSESGSSD